MKRENKIHAIVSRLAQGKTNKEIINELKIPRRTYFYWKRKIKKDGLSSVVKKKKPGPSPKNKIKSKLSRKILRWRDRYGWGPCKIEGHLKAHHSIKISHRQIYNLLCKKGRNEPIKKPRRIKGKKRYERSHSMSLLHVDWKDIRSRPMITYLDDHSRFVTGSKKFSEATTENSVKLLEKTIKKFGKPKQVLTDKGSQFWNNKGDHPTLFTQFCIDNNIEHIKCSKNSPQANGKLESFHGCYDSESWRFKTHRKFINYWNNKRPHGGINYLYPVEVFYRDRRKCN